MARWRRGEADIERLLAADELQRISGEAADGGPWLAKARRTIGSARKVADTDPEGGWVFAYDAARYACVAALAQQGLRATGRGGHVAVETAVRAQFDGPFDRFGSLRRQRNDIEYPMIVSDQLTRTDAETAAALADELITAVAEMLPHLGMFT